jgi:hypothetical protein
VPRRRTNFGARGESFRAELVKAQQLGPFYDTNRDAGRNGGARITLTRRQIFEVRLTRKKSCEGRKTSEESSASVRVRPPKRGTKEE